MLKMSLYLVKYYCFRWDDPTLEKLRGQFNPTALLKSVTAEQTDSNKDIWIDRKSE